MLDKNSRLTKEKGIQKKSIKKLRLQGLTLNFSSHSQEKGCEFC